MDAKENGNCQAFLESGTYSSGLTKREAFAMAAMQGMLADEGGGAGQTWIADDCARRSVQFADAILRALALPAQQEGGE